nr:MAG TPA: hypothetical protein [Bacteriophage sp.]
MALKTTYKDDIYDGNRKYQQISNADGTISLVDQTNYTQEGDSFKAEDINATNAAINRLYDTKTATLTAGGWTSSTPYTQTVTVPGMKESDRPEISCTDDLTSKANKKARRKEWGKVDRIVTANGQITAYCNFEKPTLDLPLEIKGA